MGCEVVDTRPLLLLDSLLDAPLPEGEDNPNRPSALGIDSRTRGFDPAGTVRRIKKLRASKGYDVATLFVDCAGAELERRYSETRRRHPLAQERPAADGIARARESSEARREGKECVSQCKSREWL